MLIQRLLIGLCVAAVVCAVGKTWFLFSDGGYHAELWLARFDQTEWVQNKMDGLQSPRRPMVKSLMRKLNHGMTQEEVEAIVGPPDYEMMGWSAYIIGYPRWRAFAFDSDVFEVRYDESGRLVEVRVRST